MHIACPHCGGNAFRVPTTVSGLIDLQCVACGKPTAIDVSRPGKVLVMDPAASGQFPKAPSSQRC